MTSPTSNRATINGPASVERNTARLQRLRAKLAREDLPADRRASLTAEAERLAAALKTQRDAITAALEGRAAEE